MISPSSRIREGNVTLELLVKTELERLYRVAFWLTRNQTNAEDVVAQTLLQATKGWPAFDGRYPVSWLLKILTNVSYQQGVRRSRQNEVTIEAALEVADREAGEQHMLANLEQDRILQAITELDHDHRVVITLCDLEGLSYEEVASVLNVPKGTIASRLYRARHALEQSCRSFLE